jgi:hypothetical protein
MTSSVLGRILGVTAERVTRVVHDDVETAEASECLIDRDVNGLAGRDIHNQFEDLEVVVG